LGCGQAAAGKAGPQVRVGRVLLASSHGSGINLKTGQSHSTVESSIWLDRTTRGSEGIGGDIWTWIWSTYQQAWVVHVERLFVRSASVSISVATITSVEYLLGYLRGAVPA
jgi:hypothetical protein